MHTYCFLSTSWPLR